MQPSAFVRPLRPTVLRALRVLTRLAMAALVLTLTFGGATATTAAPSTPAAVQLRPALTGPPQAVDRPVDERAGLAERPPRDPAAADRPAADRPATTPVRFRPVPLTAAPDRGPLGLRGPPRA
ncbi:hypothetical protein [Micromonospora cathayae]|uniref:Secreted protein n=1 Tax=Micromonospora cathayae TaxID=3028804 RepID=A0ABY7ZUD3_9ACTN|nr:hypothetical protein [Micromonospora sp. HUAS 3]WDZ86488.1 hypothetical protein PVK37_08875 [Micromonospora sp. HUAS 3]